MTAKLGVAIFALITFPCTHGTLPRIASATLIAHTRRLMFDFGTAEVPGVAIHKPKVDQIFQPGETIVVSVSVSGFRLPAGAGSAPVQIAF